MGASITAYIEIDDNTQPGELPFTYDPSVWDLSSNYVLAGGKHYEFYAAICGVRNKSGIPPLFPCRGLPPRPTPFKYRFDADDPNVSWLTLSEIRSALEHMRVNIASLDKSVQLVLRTMQTIEDLYGRDRVRLVFEVSD
jgi:hypothetical protein